VAGYVVSPQARQDLFDILDYVADRDTAAATRLRERLFASFDRLARRPQLGHARTDLAPAEFCVRFWPVGRYLVIYRPASMQIQIVRVLSAYRDVAAILAQATDD
jgi:plasmid stabilization system protein ParE